MVQESAAYPKALLISENGHNEDNTELDKKSKIYKHVATYSVCVTFNIT